MAAPPGSTASCPAGQVVSVDQYLTMRWRCGRHVGRTLYAMPGPEPSDSDPLIGVMDTPELAARAVADHNAGLVTVRRFTGEGWDHAGPCLPGCNCNVARAGS